MVLNICTTNIRMYLVTYVAIFCNFVLFKGCIVHTYNCFGKRDISFESQLVCTDSKQFHICYNNIQMCSYIYIYIYIYIYKINKKLKI